MTLSMALQLRLLHLQFSRGFFESQAKYLRFPQGYIQWDPPCVRADLASHLCKCLCQTYESKPERLASSMCRQACAPDSWRNI